MRRVLSRVLASGGELGVSRRRDGVRGVELVGIVVGIGGRSVHVAYMLRCRRPGNELCRCRTGVVDRGLSCAVYDVIHKHFASVITSSFIY